MTRASPPRAAKSPLLADGPLAACPVFEVAASTGAGVPALRAHLEAAAAGLAPRRADGRFRLPIDRCFSLAGAGTVVTGTAHAGRVGAGDTVMIMPPGLKARVRSLHVQDRPAQSGQAGERCALALSGDFGKRDIARGMWLVDPALALPRSRFQGELRVPAGQAPLKHLQTVHVHLGTDDIMGRVALLDVAEAVPGTIALVEILLERETLALRGDRFVLRDAGARRTVAGGRVLDIFPGAAQARRRTPGPAGRDARR